jgi:hypothetical protein
MAGTDFMILKIGMSFAAHLGMRLTVQRTGNARAGEPIDSGGIVAKTLPEPLRMNPQKDSSLHEKLACAHYSSRSSSERS